MQDRVLSRRLVKQPSLRPLRNTSRPRALRSRATIARLQQLNAIRGRLLRHGEQVIEVAQRLQSAPGSLTAEDAKSLEHAAEGIATLFEVLAMEQVPAGDSAATPGAAPPAASG